MGAVITDSALIKKRKGSKSKPTIMLSQLPLLLTDNIVHAMIFIAARHDMLGVSGLPV